MIAFFQVMCALIAVGVVCSVQCLKISISQGVIIVVQILCQVCQRNNFANRPISSEGVDKS